MDTGASLMASPPLLYEPLIEKITKNTSCDDWSTFPTIGFMIDGQVYSLEPFEYVLGEESEINYT